MDQMAAKTDSLEKLFGAQLLWKIDNFQQVSPPMKIHFVFCGIQLISQKI